MAGFSCKGSPSLCGITGCWLCVCSVIDGIIIRSINEDEMIADGNHFFRRREPWHGSCQAEAWI